MTSQERGSEMFSVLIVDDDASFRALVKILLEATGCQVIEGRSAKDADQQLEKHNPSLVIVDYRIPGMDGIQWITKFREAGYETPVVFLSGSWCDLKTFTKLRTLLRVSLILQKPIVPELFLDQIESLLPRSRTGMEESYASPQAWEAQQSFEVYSENEPLTKVYEACQDMDSELAPVEAFIPDEKESAAQPLSSAAGDTAELRSLFENEILSQQADLPQSFSPSLPAYGRDIMKKSAIRLPAFPKPDAQKSTNEVGDQGKKLPDPFSKIPRSRDNPDEMEVISSEEPDALEQLKRFSQKANVEKALRFARSQYAKVLPEKVEELKAALLLLKAEPANGEHYNESKQIAHQLKGTSGSLGFPHLGKTVGTIESLLLDGAIADGEAGEKIWQQIERQVAQCLEIAKANALAEADPETAPRKAFVKKSRTCRTL